MTDIPILFKPDMIAAIEEGRKTQTRRIETRAKAGDRMWNKEVHYKFGRYVKTGTETRTGKDKTEFSTWSWTDRTFMFDRPSAMAPDKFHEGWHKRSPLFMEKRYARKWLRVTSVHEERLQDISDDDAAAEGVDECPFNCGCEVYLFEKLWDSIYGADPEKCWAANPMVKVIKFEVEK